MSSRATTPSLQELTVGLPTRAEMCARIAAHRGLAPAALKAREEALCAHIDAAIAAARCSGVRGLAPAARLGPGEFGGSNATDAGAEPGEDDGPGIRGLLDEPAPLPNPREPFRGPYKRARDLSGTVFPVSEFVILDAARKAGIGRKFGRVIVFSPADVHRLYEVMPCPSGSSAAPNRRVGSCAAPSGASALKKARALLTMDERSAKGAPKKSGRSARSRSSSRASTVAAYPKPSRPRS